MPFFQVLKLLISRGKRDCAGTQVIDCRYEMNFLFHIIVIYVTYNVKNMEAPVV